MNSHHFEQAENKIPIKSTNLRIFGSINSNLKVNSDVRSNLSKIKKKVNTE